MQLLLELTLGASEELPRIKVEVVGPMGLVSWPARGSNRPQIWYLGCPGVPCPNPTGHGLY